MVIVRVFVVFVVRKLLRVMVFSWSEQVGG